MEKINFTLSENPFALAKRKLKSTSEVIPIETNYRTKQTIDKWQTAIELAENPMRPMWQDLLDIYRTVIFDSTISRGMMMRYNKVVLKDYIISKNDKPDDKLKEIFDGQWFRDFIEIAMESIFYGYSVIEFQDIIDGKISGVHSVDRFYIIPERKEIKKNKWDTEGIPLDKFDVLFVGKKKDLGLLAKASNPALVKKETMSAYAMFTELYGQPTMVTKMGPNEDKEAVMDFMENRGANGYVVTGNQTQIDMVSSTTEGGVYKQMIDYLDDQINSIISGVTNQEARNYATALKDDETEDDVASADNVFIEDLINSRLIPLLISFGFTELQDSYFEFVYEESVDKEQFEVDIKLLEHYELDIDYLNQKYNTNIVGVKNKVEEEKIDEKEIKQKLEYENLFNKYYKKNI